MLKKILIHFPLNLMIKGPGLRNRVIIFLNFLKRFNYLFISAAIKRIRFIKWKLYIALLTVYQFFSKVVNVLLISQIRKLVIRKLVFG